MSDTDPGTATSTVTPSPLPFPTHLLPLPVRRLVTHGAHSLSCPTDYIAVPALTVLSTAIGSRYRLRLKSGWAESANLYTAVVADPGAAKTPALGLACTPLVNAQGRLERDYRRIVAELLRRKKEGEEDLEIPTAPQQILTVDTTAEALALMLRANPHGVCCRQDELSGFTAGFNRYRSGKGADRQFFSSLWSGEWHNVNRIKHSASGARALDTTNISDPWLSIVGGIQPSMLTALLEGQGRDDGFIHRWLFSWPYASTIRTGDTEGVAEVVQEDYRMMVDRLLALPDPVSPHLQLTDEAKQIFFGYLSHDDTVVDNPDFPAHLRGPWRKLQAYCGRLALILHVSRMVCGEACGGSWTRVGGTAVADAITLIEYFKSHAVRVYDWFSKSSTSTGTSTSTAKSSDPMLDSAKAYIAYRGGTVTIRDLIVSHICRNKQEALAIVSVLEQSRLVVVEKVKSRNGGEVTYIHSTTVPGTNTVQ